jgi:16S rRNA (cytosine1402-N4)-methyltransferase
VSRHQPVLLKETLEFLDLRPNDNVIDCTLGGGGHSRAILERTSPNGKILAIDADADAIVHFKIKIQNTKPKVKRRLELVNDNFRNLENIYASRFPYPVHACLLDLGLSSDQLEVSGRGFSFQKDEPLDMRFSAGRTITDSVGQHTAAVIVNKWPQAELERIFRIYSDEKNARLFAARIFRLRKSKPIATTKDLVDIILRVNPRYNKHPKVADARRAGPASSQPRGRTGNRLHPATKIFQALRIAVNSELASLEKVLPQALSLLQPQGRLVVISFHDLEDRIVKHFIKISARRLKVLTKKPVRPGQLEIKKNHRARSARLRAIEKIT